MTAVFAPAPWPAPGVARRAAPWRFGRELDFGGAQRAVQWVLRRNCSVTPRQLLGFYASVCVVSLAIGLGFWFHGAPAVLLFAGLELAALGLALLVFARHATDRETITLDGADLAVEHRCGSSTRTTLFRSAWVRVEPRHAQGSAATCRRTSAPSWPRSCAARCAACAASAEVREAAPYF
jgi:uncharacterized membrane protein